MIPFCDTPEQSAFVGLLAGLIGGVIGVVAGLDTVGVVLLAGGLALLGDVGAHVVRGDDQWQAAIAAVRGR